MTNNTDEIEELRKQVLLVAKVMESSLCRIQYNMLLPHFKGEARKSYVEHWDKKLEVTEKEIGDSSTIEQAMDAGDRFHKEFGDYVRATKVDTADKAMEIAHSFIKKYSAVALPLKAEKEKDIWLVDIDVGALATKIAKVKVDARTGDILSYDIPTKESKKAK